MIHFTCPKCGTKYEVEDVFSGAHAECEVCGAKMVIPAGCGPEILNAKLVESHDRPQETDTDVTPAVPPKLSPRQRRLMADWKKLMESFSEFPFIRIESYVGSPPEKYVVSYHVKGIERVDGKRIVYRDYHEVEIKLPGTYPRTPPLCRMLTPIFHPNIEPAVICIGDHWTAAERLCDLIVRIGEMITYQAHNIRSPLDGEAAMWTDLHQDELPIDSSDLTPPNL